MSFSLAEKVLIQSTELHEYISKYTDSIGSIEQLRTSEVIVTDNLLKCNQEPTVHESGFCSELEPFSMDVFDDVVHAGRPLVVTETERQLLLHEWNNVEKETVIHDYCVHQLFEEQATLNPHAIAVVYQDKKISYGELNAKANCVAQHLKNEGVVGNTIVAIYVERSIEMIVGLLGILKAGGAYLPLDYNYPDKALNFMFNDSGASIVLSQRKFINNIPFEANKILFVDDIFKNSLPEMEENHNHHVSVNNLGYVIYTSGSSGHPKGVMLGNKALTNLMNWHRGRIQEQRNVLQFTTLNFDMSFLEIFSALSSGGVLTLISEQDRRDLLSFSKIIKKHHVQQLVITVPFLKGLVSAKLEKDYFNSLKEIIIAGEQLVVSPAILSFFNQLSSCKLLNYYGPSETHVVTAYEFPQKTVDWPDHPPIGRVISNTKVLILDDEKQLVPIGVSGEIYIGGVSLAKGYMNKSDLTKEKFISDSWSDNPNARLYRTGDFGKYLPDGNIIFLGRKDEQVKIRGFRIELKEIELNLIKYPGIKEAIVIAKNDNYTDKRLEAFIVIDGVGVMGDDFIGHVSVYLQERLPAHMIPSTFNIIDAIPLTDSGKINRGALEKKGGSIVYSSIKNSEPNTNTEAIIIAIMEDVFKLHIGINNSFTSIGGNSLLAMHLVSRLRDEFSVELPAYRLLSDPTIADTAKRIDALISQENKLEKVALITN